MAVELQHAQHLDVWMDNVFVDADSSPTLTFRARSRETLGTNLEAFVEETEEDFAAGEAGDGPEVITMSIASSSEKGKQSASSNESRGSSRGSASSLNSKQNGAAQVGKPAMLLHYK
jgi:hypothetical protein